MNRKASKLPADPQWYKDAIIYEVHVKSFFDSNGDGIGDFIGLMQKLDYLQDLGITCLWLLPFYPSPLRDDGYDIADYRGVHPSYGTRRDFRNLVREAHHRGIRVITELVINHTSDTHPWFQAARQAPPGSAKRNFYVWSDSDQKYSGARIIFKDYEKSNWTWDPVAKAYYWHRFFHHQPDLNFDNPLVRRALMKVMRFWLDMGVDGLRLDAIPYLIEREGTNCENLAETHDILKGMRRELDAHYKDRMFLAEANQWPADVRPYFGDGDECHMAFHFPLMPRIFMALRQEDRHPITDILKQTPEIPGNCQWAIFLRNHDELTLEMVTDGERDYMYSEYAADPLMRVNLGIRRRLATLLNNSRRRLELLNSLLFSFPGTPVIYYGDEIGMGDNFYLGDRNGVRTPMQWSSDRNAGFSRADFARLFCPPIMDSVYSYLSVNVEAQQRDPSSFLNWIKRMISVSKHYKTFGRGTLEFLSPKNRKVLAYIRRYKDDILLAVANLSRFVQPVELNLSEFKGRMPVELLGRVEFPLIGELPYFLTLGPHSFYWFQLQQVREQISLQPSEAPPKSAESLATLSLRQRWDSLVTAPGSKKLESEVLPGFVARQRWFGGKGEKISTVQIEESVELPGDLPARLWVIEVADTKNAKSRYLLPVTWKETSEPLPDSAAEAGPIIARVQAQGKDWILKDAVSEDAFCRQWLAWLANPELLQKKAPEFRVTQTKVFAEKAKENPEELAVERLSGEQSNTSVRFGRQYILKLFRRFQPGVNPDFEISRYLTEHSSFDRFPKLMGAIELQKKGETATVAMLQEYIGNQGDGWSRTLDELSRFFERAVSGAFNLLQAVSAETPGKLTEYAMSDAARDAVGTYVYAAGLLGKRTAELHLALAQETSDPAFKPESFTEKDGTAVLNALRRYARQTFKALESASSKLPLTHHAKVEQVLEARERWENLMPPENTDVPRGRIRVHGDYHLGQVLWSNNDFYLLDFEGEPARPLAERRQKISPLKDVASMIRSFHYAAYAGLLKATAERPAEFEKLEPGAKLWYQWTVWTFLREYRQTTADAGIVPASSKSFEFWLDVFLAEKALYEIQYELNNRPSWIGIPLEGVLNLVPKAADPAAR
jgi:maltose alpha-D-glucosyltransferase / alpha-amylase